MASEDVDWMNLAADKHRWLDVVKKCAGFAECNEYLYWVRNCQLVEMRCSLYLAGVHL
jgi:hypothetical protein